MNDVGDRADAVNDPEMLRLENMDTDLAPPAVAVELTRRALNDDAANSYLPFEGRHELRQAAVRRIDLRLRAAERIRRDRSSGRSRWWSGRAGRGKACSWSNLLMCSAKYSCRDPDFGIPALIT